ncbi:MAG: TonB-dependent receptor, partial [Bacteroidia bacterium]|nr:TonB-dependent receptor [Bacteroidia bacterium]
ITSQSQGFQNQYEFSRAKGSYLVKGLDLLIRKQFQGISSWISYGFMNSDYTFKELQPNAFRSNYDISHALTAGISFKIRNLQLAAGLNWHSGRPTTRPLPGEEITDNTINYGPTNEDELDDYLRLDLSAMYNFNLGLKTKAKVGISVWNILNRENSINNFYRIENEALSETIQRSLGITPNAMIRVLF